MKKLVSGMKRFNEKMKQPVDEDTAAFVLILVVPMVALIGLLITFAFLAGLF